MSYDMLLQNTLSRDEITTFNVSINSIYNVRLPHSEESLLKEFSRAGPRKLKALSHETEGFDEGQTATKMTRADNKSDIRCKWSSIRVYWKTNATTVGLKKQGHF